MAMKGQGCSVNSAHFFLFLSGLAKISSTFKLCSPLKDNNDFYHLLGWIRNSLSNLAMFDYPYPAKLFSPLPAKPVTVILYFNPLPNNKILDWSRLKACAADKVKVAKNWKFVVCGGGGGGVENLCGKRRKCW